MDKTPVEQFHLHPVTAICAPLTRHVVVCRRIHTIDWRLRRRTINCGRRSVNYLWLNAIFFSNATTKNSKSNFFSPPQMNPAINPCGQLASSAVCCFTVAPPLFPITFTFTPWNSTPVPITGRGNSLHAPRLPVRLCQQWSAGIGLVVTHFVLSLTVHNDTHAERCTLGEKEEGKKEAIFLWISKWLRNVLHHRFRLAALQTHDLRTAPEIFPSQWSVIPSLLPFVHFNVNFVRARDGPWWHFKCTGKQNCGHLNDGAANKIKYKGFLYANSGPFGWRGRKERKEGRGSLPHHPASTH